VDWSFRRGAPFFGGTPRLNNQSDRVSILRVGISRLSFMAIDIFSISLMSDKPERVFSGARRTVSWDRGQIEPETIEMRECLKD
jgi:hypothetical protein